MSLSQYRIKQKIGEGGFSITHKVVHKQKKKPFILKELCLDKIDDWKTVELFEREAKVLSHLEHAHIPSFYDTFSEEHDGVKRLFLVQEFIKGNSLQHLIENGKFFTAEEVEGMLITLLKVLEYLHQFSPPIIHRDIKPDNIMLSESGKVYLIDFGAVKQPATEDKGQGATVIGTFGYMALEQLEGRAVPASDIYALGMSMVYILSHKSPTQLPKKGLEIDFKPFVNISDSFARVLSKMIHPDVKKRYNRAQDVLKALEGTPPNPVAPIAKWNKNPLFNTVGIVAALALLGFCSIQEKKEKPAPSPSPSIEAVDTISRNPNMSFSELRRLADSYYSAKKYNSAIKYYTQALHLNQEEAEVYFRRAFALGESDRHTEAIPDFKKAYALDPEGFPMAQANVGWCLLETGKYTEAIEILNAALSEHPDQANAHNNRGRAHLFLGQYQEALQDFNKTIALDATFHYAYNNKGEAYQKMKQFPEALKAFDEAIAARRTYALPHYNKGEIYYDLKKYELGIAELNQAIFKSSKYASAYNMRGLCYRGLKDYLAAESDFKKALSYSPKYSTASYNLALTYDDKGELDKAITQYHHALKIKSNYGSALNNLGYIYERKKEYKKALEHYQKAAQANPSKGLYKENIGDSHKALKQCEQAQKAWKEACSLGKTSACERTCS